MARQLTGGADLLDVVGGGFVSRNVEAVMSQTSQMIRSQLPKFGLDFIDRWRDTYKSLDMNTAMNLMEKLRSKDDRAWDQMAVRRLNTLEDIQQAGPVMQRWIMAHPETRRRYLSNAISGYQGYYTNVFGNQVGEDHSEYRRVMSGVGHLVDGHYHKRRYGELLSDGDIELRPHQQMNILQCFDFLGQYYDSENAEEELEDPTCEFGTLM